MSAPAGAGLKSIMSEVFHGKYRIVVHVFVVPVEHLRRQLLVARRTHAEVEMRRAVRMAVHHPQEIASRAVERNRIRDRAPGAEGVAAFIVVTELAA